ncbi:MAG TPA: hypothetical protein VFO65_10770, partial [Acidimicrobiales bacterium]|nr:hypothetical protein [Acidimicrobiales bacterium]
MTTAPVVGVSDLAPLRRRLRLLQLLRLGIAVSVSAAAVLAPGWLGRAQVSSLVGLSLAYAALTSAVEPLRRRLGTGSVSLVGALVLVDGLYLAAVLARTGGPQSALSFLVLVHVIAVTLLLSFRSGLKTALWHALLLF